jgi:NADH-quinone oxidoreductase subunit E
MTETLMDRINELISHYQPEEQEKISFASILHEVQDAHENWLLN